MTYTEEQKAFLLAMLLNSAPLFSLGSTVNGLTVTADCIGAYEYLVSTLQPVTTQGSTNATE